MKENTENVLLFILLILLNCLKNRAAKVIPFWEKTTTKIAADLGKKNAKYENGSNFCEQP